MIRKPLRFRFAREGLPWNRNPGSPCRRLVIALVVSLACGAPPVWADAFAGLVNLNTATAEQLQRLPGVGPSKATRIIEHRQRRAFRTVAELVRVKGFGAKTYQRLRPFLTVDEPTRLEAASPGPCTCACEPPSPTGPPVERPRAKGQPPTTLESASPAAVESERARAGPQRARR